MISGISGFGAPCCHHMRARCCFSKIFIRFSRGLFGEGIFPMPDDAGSVRVGEINVVRSKCWKPYELSLGRQVISFNGQRHVLYSFIVTWTISKHFQ